MPAIRRKDRSGPGMVTTSAPEGADVLSLPG
jgi:hypothetical protein